MASEYYIYCSHCGFYPSGDDVSVGVSNETHAENLAGLHSGGAHQCFVIPGHWMDSETETCIQDTKI